MWGAGVYNKKDLRPKVKKNNAGKFMVSGATKIKFNFLIL